MIWAGDNIYVVHGVYNPPPSWVKRHSGRKTKKRKRQQCTKTERFISRYNALHPKQQRAWLRVTRHMERAAGILTWRDIQRLYYGQNRRCFYCRERFRGGSIPSEAHFEIEHKKPVCQGGRNDRGNVVLACPKCNGEKWMAGAADYIASRRRRGLPTLSRSEQFPNLDLPERLQAGREKREQRAREREAAARSRKATVFLLRRRPERGKVAVAERRLDTRHYRVRRELGEGYGPRQPA